MSDVTLIFYQVTVTAFRNFRIRFFSRIILGHGNQNRDRIMMEIPAFS